MFQSFKFLVFYVLLLSCINSLNSFASETSDFPSDEPEIEIEIKFRIKDESNTIIGEKEVLEFQTDFNDTGIFNLSTIENDSLFTTEVESDGDNFNAFCKLWISSDSKIHLFCNFGLHNFTSGYQYIKISKKPFEHNNKNIWIIFPENSFQVKKLDFIIPFLYSDKQEINIDDKTELYELKFKFEAYNKDPLYIYGSNNNYANLDNCHHDTKEITCKIPKEKLEEILVYKNEQFKIGAMNENLGVISFDNILDITIKYENVQKQDIYLEIKEIIGAKTEIGVPVGLVTNVTNIPNFISAKFEDMKYFKKVSPRPLILFYNYTFEIDYYMKSNYTKEVVINNIHYKYNFRIQPSKFEGRIRIRYKVGYILLSYPQELIYNNSEDKTYKIMIIMDDSNLRFTDLCLIQYIRQYIYHRSPYLSCEIKNKMKVCSVSKSYFDKRQSGNYYISYNDYLNMYYDSPPIIVSLPLEINILDKYKHDPIYIGNEGKLYLKTYYNDSDPNVFDDVNIEENTKFNLSFSCGDKKYKDISCHLWKNLENVVFIFCQLKESLINNDRYINTEETKFIYNKLEIPIRQKNDISFVQIDKSIPFLSSKTQTINLEEGINTYYLKFNVENYQNEKIIFRKSYSEVQLFLDKCSVENKELACPFNKSELGGHHFEYNSDMEFYIYYPYINYTGEPVIPIPTVDLIFIKYNLPKIDLKITISKLLDKYIDELNIITYEVETNVTNISNLVSEILNLNFEYADGPKRHECFFKKTNENPLYLLCYSRDRCNNVSVYLSEIKEEIELIL